MRRCDNPNALTALRFEDLFVEPSHLGPVHFWPEMVFGVVAIIEPNHVVPLVVRTHPPSDRLVGIPAVMQKVAI